MSSNGVLDIITYLITFNSAGKILNLSDAEIITLMFDWKNKFN